MLLTFLRRFWLYYFSLKNYDFSGVHLFKPGLKKNRKQTVLSASECTFCFMTKTHYNYCICPVFNPITSNLVNLQMPQWLYQEEKNSTPSTLTIP